VFLVALVGPAFVGVPKIGFDPPYQPPVGLSASSVDVSPCVGQATDGVCFGTMKHPLGTDGNSRDVVTIVVTGLRISLEVALISAMLLVPLATAVGTVAAEYGGWVDDVLMRFVDLQQVVPAFFVYIVVQYVFEPRLTLMLVVFGLLSWGSIARMVRSEAVQKREAEYVRAAESAGASRPWIVRKHIVPNVSNTVISAVTLQIPTLIVIEAALSYLALGDPTVTSIGNAISGALNQTEFPAYWWVSTAPLVALLITVVALNLFGDTMRDVLDPRMER
jgi:peptide/nickel transport system permease protein